MNIPKIVRELKEEEKMGKLKNYYENESSCQYIDDKIEDELDIANPDEKFLNDVFNSISEGISVLDLDLNIIKVNHFIEKMYSHKMPIVGKKCHFVYQNNKKICPWCPTVKSIKQKKTCRSIVPYPDFKNPKGWMEISTYPLINSSDNVYGIIEYVKDITEQKNQEKQLTILSSVIKQSRNTVAIMDVNGIVEYANPYLLKQTNLKKEDIIGKHWSSWISKNSTLREKLPEITETVLVKGQNWTGEVSDIDSNGNLFWREPNIIPIKNSEGIIEHVAYISKDITDIKKSEENYRTLVDLAPIGILALDRKGVVKSCNPAFLELSGYSGKEIIDKHFLKLPTLSKKFLTKNVKLIKKIFEGENPSFEFEWIHKDGSIRLAEGRVRKIKKDQKSIGFLATVDDITEKKKNQEELLEAHKLLAEINMELEDKVIKRTEEIGELLKQKNEFINQLGHDLKNPLNPLLNLLPLIEKTEKDEKRKEMLRVVNRNVGYMRNLVTKTIELGRLNSPNTELHFEKTNLFNEVNKVISNNKYLIDKKQINVINDVSNEITVTADIIFLEELFNNLLNNSLKFTKEKGKIEIDAKIDKAVVTVSVKDNGIGMSKDQLSQIFDEFYKADSSRHDFESSGLGMPICKRIVERHGGKIWADSEGKGKGSTFYFTLRKGFGNKKVEKKLLIEDRLRFINYKDKEILFMDFSNLKDVDYYVFNQQIVEYLTNLGKYDLLVLTDIHNNYFCIDQARITGEAGKIVEPFMKKNAVIGTSRKQEVFLKAVKLFSGLKIKSFKDITEAKDWLVE